jgi:hypothetical protein
MNLKQFATDLLRSRKGTWLTSVVALTSGAALLAAPTTARGADVVVTLDRAFLERAVEEAVTRTVIAAAPKLYWGHVSGRRVEITRKDVDSLNIDLDLAYDYGPVDPEVDVNIEVGFGCFYGAPDVNLSVPRFDVDVNFPTWLIVATGGLSYAINHIANVVIDKKIRSMNDLKQSLVTQVNERLGQQGFEFCPAFNVTSGTDVQVIFGVGSECSPGQQRRRSCPSNTTGSGYTDICVNGYWERTGVCEPKAPPGGHQQ